MKCVFIAALFFISGKAFSQQIPSSDKLLMQLQNLIKNREPLPVRKQTTFFPARTFRLRDGRMVTDSSFQVPPSPLYSLYYTKEDDRLLSDLALSVKTYMADLKKKKEH